MQSLHPCEVERHFYVAVLLIEGLATKSEKWISLPVFVSKCAGAVQKSFFRTVAERVNMIDVCGWYSFSERPGTLDRNLLL